LEILKGFSRGLAARIVVSDSLSAPAISSQSVGIAFRECWHFQQRYQQISEIPPTSREHRRTYSPDFCAGNQRLENTADQKNIREQEWCPWAECLKCTTSTPCEKVGQ
jgi:hypothetical protein